MGCLTDEVVRVVVRFEREQVDHELFASSEEEVGKGSPVQIFGQGEIAAGQIDEGRQETPAHNRQRQAGRGGRGYFRPTVAPTGGMGTTSKWLRDQVNSSMSSPSSGVEKANLADVTRSPSISSIVMATSAKDTV